MFSVLIQYSDGTEDLVPTKARVEYERTPDGALLVIEDDEYPLKRGDNVFVMNITGQTVRRWKL